ncbi:D-alanine--D-alanine ligase family protein [Rosettibacter firmus]|uniref:D-alanine--D-alanine ligase family protein n=1 Tax=Rosettibacter firmus TaxID=3111522 RepID=UPI00336BE7AA
MKVAVVFNDTGIESRKKNEKKGNLGFTPYFEIEEVNPLQEYEKIVNSLKKSGYDAYLLNIKDNLDLFFKDLDKNKPDVIFNLVELFNDQPRLEMNFTGILELLNLAYTGAPPLTLGTCQNKILTKRILDSLKIKTPRYKIVKSLNEPLKLGLHYPLIVKPAYEDASVGIDNDSVVYNSEKLKKRIEFIFGYLNQPVLVEEFINGRELNVAIFGDKDPVVLPISEIDFSELPENLHPIVSFHAKWDPYHISYHKTIPICPAPLEDNIRIEAEQIALKCFKAVACRDYARVDMRLSKDNKLYVLEINPNPDLQEDAGFMRSAAHAGYSYDTVLKMIVDFAYQRKLNAMKK